MSEGSEGLSVTQTLNRRQSEVYKQGTLRIMLMRLGWVVDELGKDWLYYVACKSTPIMHAMGNSLERRQLLTYITLLS